ncbi:PLP-dependent transferase [bacterium]|nr:PLP-dependent transferase [bacterium]
MGDGGRHDNDKLKGAGFSTRQVHSGHIQDELGSVMPPVYQTSIYSFRDSEHGAEVIREREAGYVYARWGSPNSRMLEAALADLHSGAGAWTFSTGIAAVNFIYFALLRAGDHIICAESLYAPTRYSLELYWSRFGVEFSFVDATSLDAVAAAVRPNTRHIHIETPANPALRVSDIAGCAQIAHDAGARLSVDNTFMSPLLQRPLELGADIVMESLTKFVNGHSDVVGGALVLADKELCDSLYKPWYTLGATMDPHQAWLIQRGLKTLKLRVLAAQENAQAIAQYLAAHSAVSAVHFPGLPSHPQYELHQRQASGPGACISFELKGGLAAGRALMDRVQLCTRAVSLGGIETLISHPASMTHVGLSSEERAQAGVPDGLIRFAVGIEDSADIIADLEQALV